MPADQVVTHFETPERRQRVGEELSDVLLYLVRLADVLGVDLAQAAEAKLAAAATRFPAALVRGAAPLKE